MRCPKCEQQLSVWEIGAIRDCPKCDAPLKVSGWPRLFAANVVMFIVLGYVFAGAIASGSALGWIFGLAVMIVWITLETVAMRALLTVSVPAHAAEQQ